MFTKSVFTCHLFLFLSLVVFFFLYHLLSSSFSITCRLLLSLSLIVFFFLYHLLSSSFSITCHLLTSRKLVVITQHRLYTRADTRLSRHATRQTHIIQSIRHIKTRQNTQNRDECVYHKSFYPIQLMRATTENTDIRKSSDMLLSDSYSDLKLNLSFSE